jgi:archaeosortase C (PEF-CTERM variant)
LLIVLGIAYLLFVFLPYLKAEDRERKESLASRFLNFITYRGKLRPYFPVLGIALISLDLVYNIFSATPQLLTFDTVILLFGGWLVVHNFIPKKFGRERDFVFIFLLFLVLILVLPLIILRAAVGDYNTSVNFYSETLLVPPLVALLGVFGVPVLDVNGIYMNIMLKSGQEVGVGITTECSGIFSAAIFAAAFIAFVFIEFQRFSRKVGALLVLGVFASYVANILRMTVIVLVGYHFDSPGTNLQAMLLAHANFGWIIFLLWISLFWLLMYKFLMKEKKDDEVTKPKKRGVPCGICFETLKVDVPGYRCKCGKFYHLDCVADLDKCPSCNSVLDIEGGPSPQSS